jgi:hypothetical protein
MMVENGQRLALTGPFQAVQWAAISAASIVVGMAGGRLAEHASLSLTFLLAVLFPMISFGMGVWAVRESRVHAGGGSSAPPGRPSVGRSGRAICG